MWPPIFNENLPPSTRFDNNNVGKVSVSFSFCLFFFFSSSSQYITLSAYIYVVCFCYSLSLSVLCVLLNTVAAAVKRRVHHYWSSAIERCADATALTLWDAHTIWYTEGNFIIFWDFLKVFIRNTFRIFF